MSTEATPALPDLADRAGIERLVNAFYERVRAVGWVRTPDPYDAPSEASLRFRMGKADCLFNVYGDAMLMTDAEDRVDLARVLAPGEKRYHVYVMCLPVMPAAPREEPSRFPPASDL